MNAESIVSASIGTSNENPSRRKRVPEGRSEREEGRRSTEHVKAKGNSTQMFVIE